MLKNITKSIKKEKMKVHLGKKIIEIKEVQECKGMNQAIGLMFARREKANALIFKFSKPTKMAIHSFFVFFSFLAVWLDDKNRVIEVKKVKPFIPLVSSTKRYHNLLEIPLNRKYRETLKYFKHFSTGIPKI